MSDAGISKVEEVVRRTVARLARECLRDQNTHPTSHYEQWAAGVPSEILFWWHYFATDGKEFIPVEWMKDISNPREFGYKNLFPGFSKDVLRIIDVGSGPVSDMGSLWEGQKIEAHAVDPLAYAYNWILATFGHKAPIPTTPGHAERLRQLYAAEYFDFVNARNCMDHMYEPLTALEQMAELLATGGVIHLWHWVDEAEFEKYAGLHQWNMNIESEHVIFWNKQKRLLFPHEKYGLTLKYEYSEHNCGGYGMRKALEVWMRR